MKNDNKPVRDGEAGPIPIRSGRFYSENGLWYVSTREGKPIGPFDTREEAEDALLAFLEFIQSASPEMLVSFFKQFLGDTTNADS